MKNWIQNLIDALFGGKKKPETKPVPDVPADPNQTVPLPVVPSAGGPICFAGDFMPAQNFENDFCILNQLKRPSGLRTMTDPMRLAAISYLVTAGYTMAHVCPVIDGFILPDPIFMRKWMGELRRRGLQVCLWLGKGNEERERTQSEAAFMARASALAQSVGDLIDLVCLGIEIDEYGWSPDRVKRLASQTRDVFKKPVAVHTASRTRFDLLRCGDIAFIQYGFSTNTADVATYTRAALPQLGGRPLVAMEYHRQGSSDAAHRLAAAAMMAGAIGFGNGGDASSIALAKTRAFKWSGGAAVVPGTIPADAIDVSRFKCLGIEHADYSPARAKVTQVLVSGDIAKNHLGYRYGNLGWQVGQVGACMGWLDPKTGEAVGGFVDWLFGRTSCDLHNVYYKSPHEPGIFSKYREYSRTPPMGAKVYGWLQIRDERTNVIVLGSYQG